MSINVSAVLYVHCKTKQQCKRLQIYFNEETRPDFPDDVPITEAEWVEPFEFLENPDSIKIIDDETLLVEFYPEETDFSDNAKALITTLLQVVVVDSIIYCELGEDWTVFEYYTKDKRQLLWTVDGLDDQENEEKYNNFLSSKEKSTYHTFLYGEDYEKQDVKNIMLKLSKKINNT